MQVVDINPIPGWSREFFQSQGHDQYHSRHAKGARHFQIFVIWLSDRCLVKAVTYTEYTGLISLNLLHTVRTAPRVQTLLVCIPKGNSGHRSRKQSPQQEHNYFRLRIALYCIEAPARLSGCLSTSTETKTVCTILCIARYS